MTWTCERQTLPARSPATTLIAPTPRAHPIDLYAHLARFCHEAPPDQRRDLWRETARRMTSALTTAPLRRSISGGGGAYLHIRIDPTPKYYSHRPYRAPNA